MLTLRFTSWLTIVAALLVAAVASIDNGKTDLKLVHVIFRHGDRTPDDNGLELYPNDPYFNYGFYPMGLGHLTNSGKLREFQLGSELRKRYIDFLGKIYVPKTVYAHSSDYDRTKMSLQLVLASLFTPEPVQMWNKALQWQPVPTTYSRRIDDNLLLSDGCPLYLEEYFRVQRTPEIRQQLKEFGGFMRNLTVLTGKTINTTLDMYYLYHDLMAEYMLNLELPEWTKDIFPYGELWDGIIAEYDLANYNTLLRRLYAGPLLREIRTHIEELRNDTAKNEKKIYLYSGHETNIASMLKALNVYEPHVPEYSSAVIFELRQRGDDYYVKVLYYLGIPPVVTELRIPGCEILCPLDQFLKLTDDLIPSDEEMICDKTKTVAYSSEKPASFMQKVKYNLIAKRRATNTAK